MALSHDFQAGNRNLRLPAKTPSVGAATYGSQQNIEGWEPQLTVPSHNSIGWSSNLQLIADIKGWELQLVVPRQILISTG